MVDCDLGGFIQPFHSFTCIFAGCLPFTNVTLDIKTWHSKAEAYTACWAVSCQWLKGPEQLLGTVRSRKLC